MTNDEIIYNTALANGMPQTLAALITAQANHETGGYTSDVFIHCKNAFGYKFVGQAGATACLTSPEGDAYAGYTTLAGSVVEICKWIKRRQAEGVFPADLNTIITPDQYAQLLKKAGYYGDAVANYTNGLVYWLQRITANIPPPAAGLGLLLLVGLGILAFRKRLFS